MAEWRNWPFSRGRMRLKFSAVSGMKGRNCVGLAKWCKKALSEQQNHAKTLGGMGEWLPLGNPHLNVDTNSLPRTEN